MSSPSEQHFKSKSKKIPDDLNPRDLIPEQFRNDPNVIIEDPETTWHIYWLIIHPGQNKQGNKEKINDDF